MDHDAQFLAGRACAAIKFEADLPVEPDPELLPLRDLGEGRFLWMPEGEAAERPGPLNRITGRYYPKLEACVVGLRPREGLDSAEYLADITSSAGRQTSTTTGPRHCLLAEMPAGMHP
ncbi:MAG TPA: hypothetical protein VMK84_19160 [Streptosporangiaceae bacterium]|nr:hypothetical protein [Streptosporangiaceae bacterium]